MTIQFRVLARNEDEPQQGTSTAYLNIDNWNDFSYVTMFHINMHDEKGSYHEIGTIKIGFKDQRASVATYKKLPKQFERLDSLFFSLGQSADFYKKVRELGQIGTDLLTGLNDLVMFSDKINEISDEGVFGTSLLRDVSLTAIKGQYRRVLEGGKKLTDYEFEFVRPEDQSVGKLNLQFNVEVDSTPNTNIHAIIGRNGVGKTTILNGMINAIISPTETSSKFLDISGFKIIEKTIDNTYFSSLASVSFSAFDPFTPPIEQPDRSKGTCYFYIGLKEPGLSDTHRSLSSLYLDCVKALKRCFNNHTKAKLWKDAIDKLGFDENFASMSLYQLEANFHSLKHQFQSESDNTQFNHAFEGATIPFLESMSSGHAIVLLTITRLVATIEEKTLVLLDEPESHLHPPLLSAFIRALSELLLHQNGVAIIATHSPVVLQEIPSSCVWKVFRQGDDIRCDRPKIETFAENVGVLTDEVFGLELKNSGFHDLLKRSVREGKTYQEILRDFGNKIGFEGRALLKTMIINRDKGPSDETTE